MAQPPPVPPAAPPDPPPDFASLARQASKVRHDLRNPLAHILGFAEMLIEKAGAQGLNFLKARLQFIQRTAQELTQRVTDDLDAERLRTRSTNIPALRHTLHKAGTRVRQTADSLRRKPAARDDVSVGDDLARIADAATRFLVLAEELLGRLQDQLAPPPAPPGAGSSAAPVPGERMHAPGRLVLLIASTAVRDELCRILAAAGYDLQCVPDRDQLGVRLRLAPAELVVMDLGHAEAEGGVWLRQWRERLGVQAPAILVVAEPEDAPAVARCLEAGAEDGLFGPLLDPIVRARVAGVVARRQLRTR